MIRQNQAITKKCISCSIEYPATTEYFHRQNKYSIDGMSKKCKKCVREDLVKNDKPVIYSIAHNETNQIYVGQTIRIKARMGQHFSKSNKIYGLLPQLIREENYNKDKFTIIVLEYLKDRNELDEAESKWISKFREEGRKLLNLQSGGKKGMTNSPVTKLKISKAKSGVKFSEEHKKKLSLSLRSNYKLGKNVGRKMFTPEQRKKHSEQLKGHKMQTGSKNSRATMSEDTVRQIIDLLLKKIPPIEIEKITGVSASKISDINRRRTWNSVVVEGYEDTNRVYFEIRNYK